MSGTRTHDPLPNLLIRASAGTGKTFRLSNRFLELLRRGVPCDRVLATTFTRKAAGEILNRVIQRLAEATEDERKRDELQQHTGGGTLTRQDCLDLLKAVMRHLHALRVGTLDSFFAKIAGAFAFELGLPAGWRIVEELDDARLRSQAIHAVLTQGDPSQLRTLLNLLSKGEAIRSVAQLIRDAVNGLYELFLETEPEAWSQVPRYRPLAAADVAEALAALRAVELAGAGLSKARDADCDRAAAEDWAGFVGKGLAKKVFEGNPVYNRKPIPDSAVAIYRRLIDHGKAESVGRVAMQTEATRQLLERFHVEYQRLKRRHRAMRFADVTRLVGDIGDLVEGGHLSFRLDGRIDHLLLDEFQDTSPAQWCVLRPLAERVASGADAGSFFCVGDVKQAIYGWRGGVAEIFDAIDRQLAGLVSESLNTSYRCSPPVIDTVNRVFAKIVDHPNLGRAESAVRRWCDRFERHETARQELAGYAELLTSPRAADGVPQSDVTLAFAAARIAELVATAPGYQVGVLVRRNKTVGRLIYELRRQGVHASEEGGNPLTDSTAVMVALSLLRVADHPGDTIARFHVAHSPLGPAVGLTDHRDDASARRTALAVRRRLLADGYGPTIYGWAEKLAGCCTRRELSRLEQLVELAYDYQSAATLRPSDFVAYVEATRVSDPQPADVRVMTIHQAKGLEFDIVVLPELDARLAGQAPSFVIERPDVTGPVTRVCRYANENIQAMMPAQIQRMFAAATERTVTESLCVLYVAITRAIHALHAIIPPSAENERSLSANFATLLRVALKDNGPAEPQTVLYQHGDPEWHRHPRPDRSEPAARACAEVGRRKALTVRLARVPDQRARGWDRAKPSGLEGGSRVHLQHVLAGARGAAFLRGELIHAWFEQIEWLDDGWPEETRLRDAARRVLSAAVAPEIDVDEQLARFHAMLRSPVIADVLSRRRYEDPGRLDVDETVAAQLAGIRPSVVVRNEHGFAVRDGAQLLTGFIDRLVLLRNGSETVAAEVLDYKTDRFDAGDPAQLSEKAAFYTPQLEAYRRAVARWAKLPAERIATTLVFVEAGHVLATGG